MAPQGFAMIHGKTDLKPFKKLSYCEFDCNWESDQNEMNVAGGGSAQLRFQQPFPPFGV
jgi:hypothetical protein